MKRPREQPIIVVRKKAHGHGHHGGAWKVAFADFMTAMMALFLVLWITTMSADVKAAVAGYFRDPLGRTGESGSAIVAGLGAKPTEFTPPLDFQSRAALQMLGEKIRERLESSIDLEILDEYVDITMVEEGMRIELLENEEGVFFELGSAVPSDRGREILALLGGELSKLPNSVVIEGHTDATLFQWTRPYSNWELSADRANMARRIVTENGIRDAQVKQVRGYADRDLRYRHDPNSPKNRRVSITMLLESADLQSLSRDGGRSP